LSDNPNTKPSVNASTIELTVKQLRKINFLTTVDDELLETIASRVRLRSFRPNTALFHEGDPGLVLYMVTSGWVRIEKIAPSGQVLVIAKLGPGSQLGELALFDGAPRMADAVTDTECELMSLERDVFLSCLMKSPSASLAVMSSLARMVRSAGANLESFRSLDTLGRLAELLIWYCDQHGSPVGDGSIKIDMRLTHQALADQVGVARETVSRCLSEMIEAKALKKDRSKIIVLSKQKLRDMIVS